MTQAHLREIISELFFKAELDIIHLFICLFQLIHVIELLINDPSREKAADLGCSQGRKGITFLE